MPTDRDLPIPAALNTALVVLTVGGAAALLIASGSLAGPWYLAAVFAYALLFQTVYSLFHEASHFKLHPDPRSNHALGLVTGVLFGMSHSMFALTHWSHHLKNRSEQESFDQVAPGQSWLTKAVFWYGMLLGLWYWLIPVANVALVIAPSFVASVSRRARLADRVFDAGPDVFLRIRMELVLWLLWVTLVIAVAGPWALGLHAAGAWLWSTTNYVDHAYAPRDVLTGAFNLRAPLYGWVVLHRELDRTHHLYPAASWVHLPRLTRGRDGAFVVHWLAQWRGPVRATAPGPSPVQEIPATELP